MKKPVRNPKLVLKALKRGLKKFPDLRVAQLLENIRGTGNDIFYVEDEDFAKQIDEWVDRHAKW